MSPVRFARLIPGILITAVSASLMMPAAGQKPAADSTQKDYSGELPRIAPLEPAEALKSFQVVEGFRIEQVAAEPLVVDPIAMAFDERGRLFVVEMRGYSEDGGDNLGRVRLLEDTDGDGRFDKSSVYLDGLSWPTAVACYDGGIFVGAAPDIHYAKDTDGDGKADVRRVVFTGFGRGNVQGLLNSFEWGPDGRLHGATSSSGAAVRPGGDPQAEPITLRGRDFAFDPRTLKLTATSGGGQHGLSFDPWGNKLVCSNSDHVQMVMYDDRYLARNPFLAAPSPRASIASDGPQADVFRISPVEPWRIVRTRLRTSGIVPGPIERGGKAAGYFTGSTGITVYLGDAWPRRYYGWVVVGDVGSNLVHRKRLERDGVGFVAHRVDERREFVASSDIWFRPVQFANGPDGALYVADMYREVIEHPLSLPPVIKRHLDLTAGRARGRIYRIVPDDLRQAKPIRLGGATTERLVAMLQHGNEWHRRTAARLLNERRDERAIPHLRDAATQMKSPPGRIAAMNVLEGLGGMTAKVLLAGLGDEHPRVREHAVRLAEPLVGESPRVEAALYQLVEDDDLRVRYQLAFSLGQLSGPRRSAALAEIARRDGADRWFQVAVMSSLGEGAGDVLEHLAADAAFRQSDAGLEWIKRLTAQIGRQRRAADVVAVLRLLRALPDQEQSVLAAIVEGLAAKKGGRLEQQIAAATGGRAGQLMDRLLADARSRALDPEQKVAERVVAIHLLELDEFDTSKRLLAGLLDPVQPQQVQQAALTALARFSRPEVAPLVIGAWSRLSPSLRGGATELLFSRPEWLAELLDAVDGKRIAAGDLEPARLKLLASHSDAAIRRRAEGLLSSTRLTRREDVLEAYREVLDRKGDVARGKLVFKKICAACHRLEGVGNQIAPTLTGLHSRGPEAVLQSVLDPNREVDPRYVNYVLVTLDGRTLTGIISAETATSVTLKRADSATDTVLRIDLELLKSSGLSLMPEGLEKQVDKRAMTDLMEYLKSVGR